MGDANFIGQRLRGVLRLLVDSTCASLSESVLMNQRKLSTVLRFMRAFVDLDRFNLAVQRHTGFLVSSD